jgi:predicted small metal-binding protein
MVKFARCNSLLSLAVDASGKGCRYVAQAETVDGVVKDMSDHLSSVHQVAGDMKANIEASTKTNRG